MRKRTGVYSKGKSTFICVRCGKENMPGIVRMQQRERNHIKTMYCPFCKIDTQNIEVRYSDNYQEIRDMLPELREEQYPEMKYVSIIFGDITKSYLFKSNNMSFKEGTIIKVILNDKREKEGIVIWSGILGYDELPISVDKIPNVIGRVEDVLHEDDLKKYFIMLVKMYSNNNLTMHEFLSYFKTIIEENEIECSKETTIGKFILSGIPHLCSFINKKCKLPLEEREPEFWRVLREWDCKIEYGTTYTKMTRKNMKIEDKEKK